MTLEEISPPIWRRILVPSIKARQAAGGDPDETARWLLARMEDDPYGFAYHLEPEAAKVMNKANLAAFARHVRARFDGHTAGAKEKARDAQYVRRRWGENFLEALRDPEHEEHDQIVTWVGGVFDPEGFDLNAVNRSLRAR